jgi:iron complex outermembrane recepter protein
VTWLLWAGLLAGPVCAEELEAGAMIVTATRLGQPLLDFPGSVTRIDARDIALRGATHHSEIMNRAAGTMIQRGSGQESLTAIRSPVLTGAGSCGAFLFLEDGIPIRPTGFCNVNDLFEVNSEQADAVEVLRGPGSALYGSNAMHGTVNVLFDDPGERHGWNSSLEGGSDEYLRFKGATSHEGDASDWGLLGHWTHDGGFRAESGFEEAKLNAQLAHRFERSLLQLRLAATDLDQETAGFIQGFEAYEDPVLSESNANPEAFRDAHSARLSAHWQRPLGAERSFDARATVRTSRMEFLQHFLLGKPLERNGQESAAVYLSWSDGSEDLRATFGLDGEFSNSFLIEFQDGPTTDGTAAQQAIRPAGFHYDYEVDVWSAAAYAQFDYALTSALRLAAGVRGEFVRYDYDNRMLNGNTDDAGVPCPLGGCLYNRPADRTDEFTNVVPKLSLSWAFQPQHRLYVSAGRGFRAPELTELYRLQRQQTVADLDSERIDSVEVGVRGLTQRFDYALAAFALEKRNVILRDANGFNVSDGRTGHEGIEYELGWSPTTAWRVSAAGTYAEHRYEFDRIADGGEQITDGNEVDTAPRNVHALRVEWQPRPEAYGQLEWLSVGEYFVDAANANRYAGHELLNLGLGWRFVSGWHAALRVNNVLDEAYADRADFAFGNYRYFPGRARTAFLEVGYSRAPEARHQ